jgi:hypothetical protein
VGVFQKASEMKETFFPEPQKLVAQSDRDLVVGIATLKNRRSKMSAMVSVKEVKKSLLSVFCSATSGDTAVMAAMVHLFVLNDP